MNAGARLREVHIAYVTSVPFLSLTLVGYLQFLNPTLMFLVAVLVWLAGLVVVAPLRESMSANDLLVAIGVTAITWTIFWFARHSRQRAWIR